jgi:hypothetical protein
MKRTTIKIDIEINMKFWALFPAININRHSKGLEFEWPCFGFYFGKFKQEQPKTNQN